MTLRYFVAHLTSVHHRYDTRIFHKMCQTLATAHHQVALVVADGKADATIGSVSVYDVGVSTTRRDRILKAPTRVFKKALKLNADIYHLHDPELIPIGLRLKSHGKCVIFDSHEDIPLQMLSKPYLNKQIRWAISQALRLYLTWACRSFDGLIAATPFIRDKLKTVNTNTIDINNYPKLSELTFSSNWSDKQPEACYVGGIAKIRGASEMVQAMSQLRSPGRLNLAGRFESVHLEQQTKAMIGWQSVNYMGFLDRTGVKEVLERSVVGLVTLHPVINYVDALPVKMFEYMSACIPVIASDFSLWREIVVDNDCGLVVDPLNSSAIAEAIDFFITNPLEAERMGRNGRLAVETLYNWEYEAKKLLHFYESILYSTD